MKTYDEMTQSVLQRATAGIAERKRRNKTIISMTAAGLCLALVLAAVGVFREGPAGTTAPQPTISLENPTTAPTTQPEETEPTQQDVIVTTGNVCFLTATEEGAELTPMQANMTLPWDQMIRVRSLKGMTKEQVSEAIAEENQAQVAFREKYGALIGEGRYETFFSEDAIICYYSAGKASVILLDNSQIESVERETTGVLDTGSKYSICVKDYTIGKGEYAVTIPAGSRRIKLNCSLSYETRKFFEENPDTPLSTIRETITLTINYKNGTKEIVVIDVTVDDAGQIYMTQRGTSAET